MDEISINHILMLCYEGHLDGYAELADAIETWLEATSRR